MTAHKNVLPGFIAGIVLTLALTGAITYAANRAETSGPAAPVSVLYDIPGQGAQPAAGTDIDGGAHGGFTPNVNATCNVSYGSPGSSTTYPMATENELVAPDGGLVPGRGTAGGRKLMYVDTMCFDSSAGFELDSASIGPMGSVSLVGNQDYLITTSDPSGDQGAVACWNRGTPIPSVDAGAAMADAGAMCFTLPKVIANSILKRAFAPNAPAYDAGTLNGTATLYFFATVSSGLAITLTPQVPCF